MTTSNFFDSWNSWHSIHVHGVVRIWKNYHNHRGSKTAVRFEVERFLAISLCILDKKKNHNFRVILFSVFYAKNFNFSKIRGSHFVSVCGFKTVRVGQLKWEFICILLFISSHFNWTTLYSHMWHSCLWVKIQNRGRDREVIEGVEITLEFRSFPETSQHPDTYFNINIF